MTAITTAKQKADVLKSVQDWGESLTFRSDPNGGVGRTVLAIVDRTTVQSMSEVPAAGSPLFVLMLVNDATDGIAASEVRDGLSVIEIATIPGDTPKRRTIRVRPDSDFATLYLECR